MYSHLTLMKTLSGGRAVNTVLHILQLGNCELQVGGMTSPIVKPGYGPGFLTLKSAPFPSQYVVLRSHFSYFRTGVPRPRSIFTIQSSLPSPPLPLSSLSSSPSFSYHPFHHHCYEFPQTYSSEEISSCVSSHLYLCPWRKPWLSLSDSLLISEHVRKSAILIAVPVNNPVTHLP